MGFFVRWLKPVNLDKFRKLFAITPEITHILQEEFLEVVRANNSVMLSGLDKLLLGVSPQSGKSEHILAIMK